VKGSVSASVGGRTLFLWTLGAAAPETKETTSGTTATAHFELVTATGTTELLTSYLVRTLGTLSIHFICSPLENSSDDTTDEKGGSKGTEGDT
jgi:hypothetical protein